MAVDLYIKTDGTISIANGDTTVTGTGTSWGGIDREGSLLITSTGAIVGVVAALADNAAHGDLSLPLVDPYAGTTLSGASYVLLPPPASFRGAEQAAIFAYFTSFLRQNAGLFLNKADVTDWSIVPNNSLVLDEATKTISVWRDGVLEPVYAVGAPFAFQGRWDGNPTAALSISGGATAVNRNTASRFSLNINANTTIGLPSNVAVGDTIDIVGTGDGSHVASFASGYNVNDAFRTGSSARSRLRITVTDQTGGTATAADVDMVEWAQNDMVYDGSSYWVSSIDGNDAEPASGSNVWTASPIAAGPQGEIGTQGPPNGIWLTWDTGTADADPGTGKVRANNATFASATKLYVSKANRAGSDIAAWLMALDDSSNTTIKANLILTRENDGAQLTCNVTAATSATNYVKLDISSPTGASLTAADKLSLVALIIGDKGTDGAGAGTVTHTAGSLGSNNIVTGNGGADVKDSGVSIDTDSTFAANSDSRVPTQKAVKAAIRDKVTFNRTYFVRTDGSDSNSGLVNSSGGAFLTIQKAVDTIAALDLNGFTIIVQIADGTYTGAISLKNVAGFAAAGSLIIKGNNTTPANVLVSTTSADCFAANGLSSIWDIRDLKVQTTTSGRGIYADNGSKIRFQNLNFGACVSAHILASGGAAVQATGGYTISGGSAVHIWAQQFSRVATDLITVTLTGTPAFSTAYAYLTSVGLLSSISTTFSGSATGTRYNANLNSVINVGGGGVSYLPGNASGATGAGSQYT